MASVANLNIKFISDTKNLQKGIAGVQQQLSGFARGIQSIGAMIGPAFAVGSIIAFGKKIVELNGIQEKAEAKVAQAVKQTGMAAGYTAEQLNKLAAGLQRVTTFGDEEILNKVTAQLLSFPNIIGVNFERAQKAVLDLSTLLDGDLQSAAIQVGKALADPVKGLTAMRRMGVMFTEAQTEMIKKLVSQNKLFEAQALILDSINEQYGGQATALAQIDIGKIEQMKNAWGDIGEILGKTVSPAIVAIADSMHGLALNIRRPYNERTWFGKFIADLDGFAHARAITNWIGGNKKAQEATKGLTNELEKLTDEQLKNKQSGMAGIVDPTENQRKMIEAIDLEIYRRELLKIALQKNNATYKELGETINSLATKIKDKQEEIADLPQGPELEAANKQIEAWEEQKKALEDYGKTVKKVKGDIDTAVGIYGKLNAQIAENNKLIQASDDLNEIARLEGENAQLEIKLNRIKAIGEEMRKLVSPEVLPAKGPEYIPPKADQQPVYLPTLVPSTLPEQIGYMEQLRVAIQLVREEYPGLQADGIATFEALGDAVESFTEKQKKAIEVADYFSQQFISGVSQGAESFEEFGKQILNTIKSVIAGLIAKGVAHVIEGTLATSSALGPFAVPIAAAAGGLAAGMFNTAIPSFAQGGLAYGPTMALVGDNPNARIDPEVTAPLSKLEGMLQPVRVIGETQIRGRDLYILWHKEQDFLNRT